MNDGDVAGLLRETMLVTLKLGGPVLALALVVGLGLQALCLFDMRRARSVPWAATCPHLPLEGPLQQT